MTVVLQTVSSLELPEEDVSTGEGTVFEVCVEVLAAEKLERPIDVHLSLSGGSATGM